MQALGFGRGPVRVRSPAITPHRVHLTASADGIGLACSIDGTELRVRAAGVFLEAGQPPTVRLELPADLVLDGDVPVVEVTAADSVLEAEAVTRFLAKLDPETLEEAAMERLGLEGTDTSYPAALLAVIRERAREEAQASV